METSDHHDFFHRLPVVASFADLSRGSGFAALPDGWVLVIGDVVDSTGAIARGAYKEVNLTGTALLAAAFNALGRRDFPFVFGGDGATFALPAEDFERCRPALSAARTLARRAYGLELRVGGVPMTTVRSAHRAVQVARVHVSEHFDLAAFRGAGLAWAERLIKDERAGTPYRLPEGPAAAGNFGGIECRWDPIRSPAGETVALVALATTGSEDGDAKAYAAVLQAVESVLDGQQGHPVTLEELRLTSSGAALEAEAALREPRGGLRRSLKRLHIAVETRVGERFMRHGLRVGGVDYAQYRPDVVRHSDFRKFDGALKMVLSMRRDQRERLQTALMRLQDDGLIAHGLHVAEAALMTCLVFNRAGGHLHFIDGEGGGYALAAGQVKRELNRRATG